MHTTVLYHANCPDGFGAAFACWQRFKDEAHYLPVSYGQPLPYDQIPWDHDVYIVDFSYPAVDLITLQQGRPLSHDTPRADRQIIVLDHHASAQRDLLELTRTPRAGLRVVFDMEESGATLTWKYLCSRGGLPDATHQPDVWAALEAAMPLFFAYLRDRDLWQWKLPDSKAISLALWSHPRAFETWEALAQGDLIQLVSEGRAIQRYADVLTEAQAKAATVGVIAGHTVPIVNATTLFSEVGDYLCAHGLPDCPTPPFAAYYMDRRDGKRQWGLRSRQKEVDCSVIAKQYGGGGHPGAAGFLTGQDWRGEPEAGEGAPA